MTSPKETMLVFGKRQVSGSPVEQALDAVSGLKPGSWESVRALAWLSRAGRELAER